MAVFPFLPGQIPEDKEILRSITVGLDKVSSFYRTSYFDDYISAGGSKIKFVTGKNGSGKSHLLALLRAEAEDSGYFVSSFSAKTLKLNDITNLYKAVISKLSLDDIASRIANSFIKDLGYDISLIGSSRTLMDYIVDIGEDAAMARLEIRTMIRKAFRKNPYIDGNFGTVFSLLCAEKLGIIQLDENSKNVLMCWINASSDVRLTAIRSLGLAPYKINKQNARSMLTSISEILHFAGYKGLFITIDDLDTLLSTSSLEEIHYTRMQRDDTYESIRQLIDDIDNSRFVMYVFAFDKELIGNQTLGLRSYQALWLRIQNEILSNRLNLFTDLLNLDSANSQLYTVDAAIEMSEKLAKYIKSKDVSAHTISPSEAEELVKKAQFGTISLPLLVNQSTLFVEDKEEDSNV